MGQIPWTTTSLQSLLLPANTPSTAPALVPPDSSVIPPGVDPTNNPGGNRGSGREGDHVTKPSPIPRLRMLPSGNTHDILPRTPLPTINGCTIWAYLTGCDANKWPPTSTHLTRFPIQWQTPLLPKGHLQQRRHRWI